MDHSSRIEKDKTKTQSSHRSFPLTAEARSIILAAKAEEEENRRQFGRVYKKNNLPHIRFHELRHSCANLLMDQGCSLRDIQEWMGHSDIQTTANIYGHLDTARKQSLADKLSQCLTR